MASNTPADPPTTQVDNGEAFPAGQSDPANHARQQAEGIQQHRRVSGTENPAARNEAQRQSDASSG